jgi:hypothetical protein
MELKSVGVKSNQKLRNFLVKLRTEVGNLNENNKS